MAQQPTIKDWVLRELVTSAKMNEQVRDVHKNSFPQLATQRGTMPFLLGAREVGLLLPPSEERILSSAGADPSWKTIGDLIVPGTVAEAMLADRSVTRRKIAIDNNPTPGRLLQATATGMAWDVATIKVDQFASRNAPDTASSYTYNATISGLASYFAFYAVVAYSRLADDSSGDEIDEVQMRGPIYANTLRSGSDFPPGGGAIAYKDSMSVQVNNTQLTWRVEITREARRRGGRVRLTPNLTFYGIRSQIS